MGFWDAAFGLDSFSCLLLFAALAIAFGFEFINGFHDTANAVAVVIYTHSMSARNAVVYSGFLNFLGVLIGGTGVAFAIVYLLPVEVLRDPSAGVTRAVVFAILVAGVIWNLGTWYIGLPVSSSHTLIGSIFGAGIAYGLVIANGTISLNWNKVVVTLTALLITPFIGFAVAYLFLKIMRWLIPNPTLYEPLESQSPPPSWVRNMLIFSCGGVSVSHGINDGQKGMGLVLLVLVSFLPLHYAVNNNSQDAFDNLKKELHSVPELLGPKATAPVASDLATIRTAIENRRSFAEVPDDERWPLHKAIFNVKQALKTAKVKDEHLSIYTEPIEFVPFWVVFCTAVALGIGTTIGYKRIVITVAEKIGKQHLTFGQGFAAEIVTAITILIASLTDQPVSTTQILSSGVAGTMAANGSGVQVATVRKILLAWLFTLPCTMLLSGTIFAVTWALFVK